MLFLLVLASLQAIGQETKKDTTEAKPLDSGMVKMGKKMVTMEAFLRRYNPRKAIMYAAILPGAGQFYNKKYWKIPFVYGGLAGMIAVVNYYNIAEIKYKDELFLMINHPNLQFSPSGLKTDQLRTIVDKARRQRDYFLAITGLFYLLQMVDAHVDAHLKEFDLNPKLQVRIEPAFENNYLTGTTSGFAIKIRF